MDLTYGLWVFPQVVDGSIAIGTTALKNWIFLLFQIQGVKLSLPWEYSSSIEILDIIKKVATKT